MHVQDISEFANKNSTDFSSCDLVLPTFESVVLWFMHSVLGKLILHFKCLYLASECLRLSG